MPIAIIPPQAFDAALPDLARILAACVNGGASVNFVLPFGIEDAMRFFEGQRAGVQAGSIVLFGATQDGQLVGTVQVVFPRQPNQRHRADIAKLLVAPAARGQGLGRQLMQAAEAESRRRGLGLLVLDTEAQSAADHLYRSMGWTAFGTVPGYASSPVGDLLDATFFYKTLESRTGLA